MCIDVFYKESIMSKICPSCNQEVDNELVFCNFCGAFAGDAPTNETKPIDTKKMIIGLSVLVAAAVTMFFYICFRFVRA